MSNELFDIPIEESVLGAICLEPALTIGPALVILKEDVFYKNENKLVFRAINELYKKEAAIDILTVTLALKSIGVQELGGFQTGFYVSSLTNRVAGASNIDFWCRILYQKYLLRSLKKLSMEIENNVNEASADCFDIISSIEKELQNMTSFSLNKTRHIRDVHKQLCEEIRDVITNDKPTGVLSGIKNLDDQTGGWQNGNLIVVAARPGMGKSAFALQLAKYPALNNTPTAILSLEMQDLELGGRLFASETHLNNTKINQKKLDAGELLRLESGCEDILKADIYMDDTPSLNITQLKNKARRLCYDKGVKLILIDYLQLMSGEGNNREQEISGITRSLKGLAKELNVPIIVLSQLSRKCEDRPDKRPMLSDLRESGAIEQDADIVMFLYCPAYYDLYTETGYEYGNVILQTKDEVSKLMLIDIAKGRGIKICEVPAKFYGETMIISNYNI